MDLHPENRDARLTDCRQLFDSGLPTGGYAHSQGLEGLVQDGEVRGADDLRSFVMDEVAQGLRQADLPIFRDSLQSVATGSFEQLAGLDELACALRPTLELRRAGAQTGRQTWRLYGRLLEPGSAGRNVYARCEEFLTEYQAPVVYGVLSGILKIPLHAAMVHYAQLVVGSFVQPAIKLLGLGPTEVQLLLRQLSAGIPAWVDAGLRVPLAEAGSMAPRWDIASSRHAYAERRLYIS